MLVFISDLHFVDESAGEQNIPAKAFERTFSDLCRHTEGMKEVKLILLGDIFDLNRTTHWLEQPEEERPWGVPFNSEKVEAHCKIILERIIEKNQDALRAIRSFRNQVHGSVEIIYIPGNHDRLCNLYDSLRQRIRAVLGLTGTVPFEHRFEEKNNYRVIAFHGHEFDSLNFEGGLHRTEMDYRETPLGDLFTSELITRLPWTIQRILKNRSVPLTPDEERLRRNLEEIDNIRPGSAVLEWLYFQVQDSPALKKMVKQTVQQVVDDFVKLKYLDEYYQKRVKWYWPRNRIWLFFIIQKLFHFFNVKAIQYMMKQDKSEERLAVGATEVLLQNEKYLYCVMGHTHTARQTPVCFGTDKMERYYLNSGTWRKHYEKASQCGFMSLKNLNYVLVYRDDERGTQSFETWSGTLKEN